MVRKAPGPDREREAQWREFRVALIEFSRALLRVQQAEARLSRIVNDAFRDLEGGDVRPV